MEYKVSVIVPVYKVEKFIEKCAHSLFSQTLNSIEYIFVNDCTPDKSIDLLENVLLQYPNRLQDTKIIHHSHNQGIAATRNTGISHAKGEYIIFCDSDDWVERNIYELLYVKAKQEDCDIVVCDFSSEYPQKSIISKQFVSNQADDLIRRLLVGFLHNAMWNKLIRKTIFNHVSFLCTEGINMLEDVSIIPRLAFYCKKVGYVPQALYHYNQQNIHSYTRTWNEKAINSAFAALKIIDTFFKENPNPYQKELCYFKLNVKNLTLQNGAYQQYKRIKHEYEEVNGMVFEHPRLSYIHKIKLWCCFHSLPLISYIIAKTINTCKSLLR